MLWECDDLINEKAYTNELVLIMNYVLGKGRSYSIPDDAFIGNKVSLPAFNINFFNCRAKHGGIILKISQES